MSDRQIDPQTQARIATYQAVLDRYQETPREYEAAVLVAVRLLIGRRGYSQTLRNLEKRGVGWVGANALAEFNELQGFMAKLLADFGDPEDHEKIAEDMAGLLAALHSDQGLAFMNKLLTRLQRRALWWFRTPAWAAEQVH